MQKPTQYTITFDFNGETYKKRNADINAAVMSVKPELLFTDLYMTVSKGTGKDKQSMERKFNLTQGRRFFLDEDIRQALLTNFVI